MLKGIPEILSPQLLKVLCEMGHSDRIVIADGNFPVESMGKDAIVVRCDGHGVPELLDAILTVIPLDSFSGETSYPDGSYAWRSGKNSNLGYIQKIVSKHDERGAEAVGNIERFAFYEDSAKAYCIIATGEKLFTQTLCFRKPVVINKSGYFFFSPKSSVGFPMELLLFIFIMIHYFSFFLKRN